MVVRKCPSCKDLVGAGSEICPRCGASFRGEMMRKTAIWVLMAGVGLWGIGHYVIHLV